MESIVLLIVLPLVLAAVLVFTGAGALQGWIVRGSAAVLGVLSVFVAARYMGDAQLWEFHAEWLPKIVFGAEVALGAVLLGCCRNIVRKEAWIPALIGVQMALLISVELSGDLPHAKEVFYVDNFSLIMVLIIGLVGGLIAVYAVSYMRDYHAHEKEVKDRRRLFFFTLFLFFSGMYGIVLCNDLAMVGLFWEITTLCSFLMIGYSRTEEATRNAFRALGLNMIGGVAFTLAVCWQAWIAEGAAHTLSINAMVSLGGAVLVPVALLGLAGLTKAAQMPFHSWLLGAMVAPTPVSALLHSSTMVKAGVFVIVKYAPVLMGTGVGYALAAVGGITFVATSLLAVTESNAKRVLAYSTIANLGLIVMCAGVGTHETVWAAILLIIFHAIAKGLLFLGVGTVEHQIGSRDIEDMEALAARAPRLTVMLLIGILGMFLAPFGMLISKYASIAALLDRSAVLALLVAFGSGPTLFFWTKWMGKLIAQPRGEISRLGQPPRDELVALGTLTVLTLLACVLFPLVTLYIIEPYTLRVFGDQLVTSVENYIIMGVMLGAFLLLPLGYLLFPSRTSSADAYMAGINLGGSRRFRGALGREMEVETQNYYLRDFFKPATITRGGLGLCLAAIAIMFALLIV